MGAAATTALVSQIEAPVLEPPVLVPPVLVPLVPPEPALPAVPPEALEDPPVLLGLLASSVVQPASRLEVRSARVEIVFAVM
jgi:hypothetical protein